MKTWLLLPLAVATLIVPTGCASIRETNNLSPSSIRTSYDSVEVRNSQDRLLVKLQDARETLGTIKVVKITTSNANGVVTPTYLGMVYHAETPHNVELAFTPAPVPPFSINLTTTVNGHTKTLRATYYGPKSIQY